MTDPAISPVVDSSSDEQIAARIDALDERYADPVREFFAAHGIRVSINRPTSVSATYHVAVGDRDFVKQIFSGRADAEKRFAIIWANGEHDVRLPRDVKIALVDASALDPTSVEEIFSFFFTSAATVLDLRTDKTDVPAPDTREPVVVEVNEETSPAPDLLEAGDSQRINSIIADMFEGSHPSPSVSHQQGEKRRGRPKKARPTWVGVIVGLVVVILSPFVWYGISTLLALGSLGISAKLLASGDGRLVYSVRFGEFWVRQASASWSVASTPMRLVGAWGMARHGERIVTLLRDIAQAETSMYNMMEQSFRVASVLFSGSSRSNSGEAGRQAQPGTSPIRLVEDLRLSAVTSHNHVGLAEANLTNLLDSAKFPFGIQLIAAWGKRGRAYLAKFRETSTFLEEFLALYPTIAGFSGKQTYLVLLQNSMELRPTGGFIGSIAVVSVENGVIDTLEVQDVYAVDGQLKGHVAPPAPIRDILHQEHWYLRDSNWDPDFRTSGQRAAWFYEKETGTRVDGVIGVSLPFIVDLLRATGPLELSDYPDRITAENFFGKALFYTQSEFFPGSTQKKDFLGSVATTLIFKLSEGRGVSVPGVFYAVSAALDRRNLQLYFDAPEVSQLAGHFGWAGSVWGRDGCIGVSPNDSCVFDPVFVAEANLAVNKANAFIERQTQRQVTLSEQGGIAESLVLTYRNPSFGPPQDAGGSYRGYLQIRLPADVRDIRVTTDGAVVSRRENEKTDLVVPFWQESQTGQFLVVGVAFDIAAGGTRTVTVSYQRGTELTFGSGGALYEAYDQQQAGFVDTQSTLTIVYPIFWDSEEEDVWGKQTLSGGKQTFLAKEAQLEYNSTIPGDHSVRVRFKK